MAILDTRIDDRLIHGQVCGYWIPEAGYQVPYITIGNMSNRPGATQIDKNTFITPEEKEAFSKLVQKGVELYIQNTPRDVKRDVTELLK